MADEPKQDRGSCGVKKRMLKMAVPALVGQIGSLLYNIVDRIDTGHIPEIGGEKFKLLAQYYNISADYILGLAKEPRKQK